MIANDVVIALIGAASVIAVAYLETERRGAKKRWAENKEDHNFVIEKLEMVGKSLGRSIDRVEETAKRTEKKIDQHVNDHAVGKFD